MGTFFETQCSNSIPWTVTLHWPQHACSRPLLSSREVGHTDLVLMYDHGSLVGLCTPDYKSLCAEVMISATLVDIQAHRQTAFDLLI